MQSAYHLLLIRNLLEFSQAGYGDLSPNSLSCKREVEEDREFWGVKDAQGKPVLSPCIWEAPRYLISGKQRKHITKCVCLSVYICIHYL